VSYKIFFLPIIPQSGVSPKCALWTIFTRMGLETFFCGSAGIWTWGLMIASHTTTPFCARYFFLLGSHVYARASLHWDPPIYTSCIAGMTGTHHHTQFYIGSDVILQISLSRLSPNLLVVWATRTSWIRHFLKVRVPTPIALPPRQELLALGCEYVHF
jgi:hypothetical protein